MEKEKLLKLAEIICELTKFGQVLHPNDIIPDIENLIAQTREETIREFLPEENYGDEDNCSTEYKNGWNDCREKILNKLKK